MDLVWALQHTTLMVESRYLRFLCRVTCHLLGTLSEKWRKVNGKNMECLGLHVSETRTSDYSKAGPNKRRDHETQKRIKIDIFGG